MHAQYTKVLETFIDELFIFNDNDVTDMYNNSNYPPPLIEGNFESSLPVNR